FDLREIVSARKGKPLSLSEAYLIRAMMREDRYERMEANKPIQQQITPEIITKTLVSTLKEEGLLGKEKSSSEDLVKTVISTLKEEGYIKKEEKPEYITKIEEQQQEILARLTKEEAEKREQELIDKAQAPLKAELEKERAERARLEEKIDVVSEGVTVEEPKTGLDAYVETDEKLKTLGLKPNATTLPTGELTPSQARLQITRDIITALSDKLEIAKPIIEGLVKNQTIQTLAALEQAYQMPPGQLLIPYLKGLAPTAPAPKPTTPVSRAQRRQLLAKLKKKVEAPA
ncbi:MAG: hypothetical protein KKB37_17085, partial [Alphaproteobacteria bacterium]|nr:hypothetical protein [Alphaproteobacteria bacterium]